MSGLVVPLLRPFSFSFFLSIPFRALSLLARHAARTGVQSRCSCRCSCRRLLAVREGDGGAVGAGRITDQEQPLVEIEKHRPETGRSDGNPGWEMEGRK
jgi:hypothetical protein